MAFVILVQRFWYLLSPLSEVWFQWWFHLWQTELYSFNSSMSFVSIFCFSLWYGGLKVSSLPLICHYSFCGNTMHCWQFWIHWSLWYFIIFSFDECNVLIGVIWHENIHRYFFPVMLWMPLIMFMLGSFPFLESWSLMKYAICPLIVCPLIIIGIMPLCLGGILRVDLTIPIVAFCSQFLV